jgi:hypothetical protein
VEIRNSSFLSKRLEYNNLSREMGFFEFMQRCLKISFVKLSSCVILWLSSCRRLVLNRSAPRLKRDEEEEENLGLLTESDLGIEEGLATKNDSELLQRAKDIVEEKAAKELAKVRKITPAKLKKDKVPEIDEEEAWLDNFNNNATNLETNIPEEDEETDFLA